MRKLQKMACIGVMAGSILILAGCASVGALQGTPPAFTPSPPVPQIIPSAPPTCPPDGAKEHCFFVPTPLPDQGVRVSPLSELTSVTSVKGETMYPLERFWSMALDGNTLVGMANESGQIKLYALDLKSGHIRQLGTSNPGVSAIHASGRYVVWNRDQTDVFAYDLQMDTETRIASGAYPDVSGSIIVWVDLRNLNQGDLADIYGYDLDLGQEFPIVARPGRQVQPKIANLWVAYLEIIGERDYRLRVHHIQTGEDFEVGAVPVFIPPSFLVAAQYFAISGNRLAWVPAQNPSSVHLYDLNTRTDRILLESESPYLDLRLDGDILVFFHNDSLIGYDLVRDTSFSIPRVPSDEWLGASSSLFLSEGRLVWALTRDTEQAQHLFEAWIVRDK